MQPFDKPIYVTRPLLPNLEKVNKKLEEIWKSQWLTNNGHQHQLLEEKLKEVLKVPYLSLFNNGTIALITAIYSLRLSGEVITTPFTFPATPHALAWNGIKPIFCDIDKNTMNIDANKIEKLITPKTTAILGVHVFGTPCDVVKIQEIADRYGLKVLYDAAHAFNTEVDGVGIGNFGDISMFSFHSTKLFHTIEGGCLTFNDKNLKPRIDLLKNFGIKNEEEVVMPGINGKMNEIQAAIGLICLDYLEEERKKRANIIKTYKDNLKDVEGIHFYNINANTNQSYQYFVIKINKEKFGISRDEVHLKLKEFNVFTRKYFYPLCSDYTCYSQNLSSGKKNLPVAKKVVEEVLCLPLYGELKVDDVEKICNILKYLYQS
jgi:dTDP-4-amino-4,6-dideoxygalactose transaminase